MHAELHGNGGKNRSNASLATAETVARRDVEGVSSRRFPHIMLGATTLVWVVSGIGAIQPFDWFLESLLVLIFVPILVVTYRRFPLSNVSYALIFGFLTLHLIGAHWAYGAVPLPWAEWGFERNHYDRVVHFAFGLLLAYPMREAFAGLAGARGAWRSYFAVEATLAFSAVYEIIEWLVALVVAPEAGLAFVGAQGDEWDAMKDMALAGVGALIAMGVTAIATRRSRA